MKFFLFYFLTCCVFENVFSVDVKKKVNDAYDQALKEVNDEIANPILADILSRNQVDDTNACYQTASSAMQNLLLKTNVDSVSYKLDRCRAAGLGILNLELSSKCMAIEVSRFQKNADNVGSDADSCIKSSKN